MLFAIYVDIQYTVFVILEIGIYMYFVLTN